MGDTLASASRFLLIQHQMDKWQECKKEAMETVKREVEEEFEAIRSLEKPALVRMHDFISLGYNNYLSLNNLSPFLSTRDTTVGELVVSCSSGRMTEYDYILVTIFGDKFRVTHVIGQSSATRIIDQETSFDQFHRHMVNPLSN